MAQSKKQKRTPLLTGLSEKEKSKELDASIPVFTSHLGMLAKANTIEDVISALKNDIVRYWVNYNYLATADFLLSVTRTILIHLRAKSDKAYPRIPPISDGWLGIKDWITDLEKALEKKSKRKTKNEKIALITDALTDNPNATSAEIGRAKGIDESDVRKLWGTIKERMKTGRRHRGQSKTDIADPSASCKDCNAPLSGSFECKFCKNIVVGECKTCHYTNEHPEDAIP